MTDKIENIINEIKSKNNFVITTHVNPDGDAIGSELALARYLTSLGKNVTIINHSPTPDYLMFMLNSNDEVLEINESSHYDIIKNADEEVKKANLPKALKFYLIAVGELADPMLGYKIGAIYNSSNHFTHIKWRFQIF